MIKRLLRTFRTVWVFMAASFEAGKLAAVAAVFLSILAEVALSVSVIPIRSLVNCSRR